MTRHKMLAFTMETFGIESYVKGFYHQNHKTPTREYQKKDIVP